LLYLSSWRDLQRWSQATAFWLFDKPEITPLPIPTNVETAPRFAAVTDCLPKQGDSAAERRFGDDPAMPHFGNQLVLAHDTRAIADEKVQKIEDLRLHRNEKVSAPQFPASGVE
jgi:hypothetical protein